MCLIFYDSNDLMNAKVSAEKAVEDAKKEDNRVNEMFYKAVLGRILVKQEPAIIHKTIISIREMIDLHEEHKYMINIAFGYYMLGEIYADNGQIEEAMTKLKIAEEMYEERGIHYYVARIHAIYANLYKKEGNNSKAKESLNKSIEILSDIKADGWVEKYEKELDAIS